ncbi:hypothetical protein G6045_25310 [Streptomyces sp. YC504]|uniref:Uncharacterized protein n=1 Tax=Streptomyces mesophilus TaxID=1775132 RepID=A0A6G4XQ72_9ACTN|nr:hypothetical protein [Streptomyces mesophilus]NGO78950.1 hypothetical protein [Streptomyces mesophilus]
MAISLSRFAVAGLAVASVLVATAGPAQAVSDKTIKIPGGRGWMTFYDDGDMFQVCDTLADGHGVSGRLIDNDYNEKLYLTDGGDSGCSKKEGYNVGQLGSYQMQLSWNGDGYDVKSEWFNE